MNHDPVVLQDMTKMLKSISKNLEEETSFGINDIMSNVKEMEDAIKKIRETCTKLVEERKYILADFALISRENRNVKDPVGLFKDLCLRWGSTPEDLIQAQALKLNLAGVDKVLLKAIETNKACPDGVAPETFANTCIAKYMDAPIKIKSLSRMKH
jgi:hypothetical protein